MPHTPATSALTSGLSGLDWFVLGAYCALLVGSGVWFARRGAKNAKDYFLAERSMPSWAVAFSILATAQSAATFIGVPERSYLGDLTYLGVSIAPIVASLIVAFVFLPRYYAAGVASPYELLESRLGHGARVATSWAYLAGKLLGAGARTYIGALPLSLAVFADTSLPHVGVSIAIIMVAGTLYTLWGGIRSVIWTDVIQVSVYLGAALVALFVLWQRIPAEGADVLHALRTSGTEGTDKLRILALGVKDGRIDAPAPFTLLTALGGLMLLNLAVMATDQDIVQRSLTCKDHRHAARSVLVSQAFGVPVVLLFLAIGLLLHIFYQRPDLMGGASPAAPASRDIFQSFILTQMPAGARGLMIAGVLAIGPIGINATLNSMASTLMNDTPLGTAKGASTRAQVRRSRLLVVACGIVLAGFAFGCAWWQQHSKMPLLDFALNVMTLVYTGLLGVFLTAVLTCRGSTASAIAAMGVSASAMLALQKPVLDWLVAVPLGDLAADSPARVALTWCATWAFPWHFLVGTALAFAICFAGSRERRPA